MINFNDIQDPPSTGENTWQLFEEDGWQDASARLDQAWVKASAVLDAAMVARQGPAKAGKAAYRIMDKAMMADMSYGAMDSEASEQLAALIHERLLANGYKGAYRNRFAYY